MQLPNQVVEDESNQCVGDVVDTVGGRHGTQTSEEDGDVDIPPEGERVATSEEIEGDGQNKADGEEPEETRVRRTNIEDLGRANTTPNDGGSEEGRRAGADEAAGLLTSADVGDIVEHPGLHTRNEEAADDCGDHLEGKHDAGRDLHVVTELEIAGDLDGLERAAEHQTLEDHVGHGLSGQNVSNDQLGHNLGGDALVGDSLKHRKRKRQGTTNGARKNGTPNWKLAGSVHGESDDETNESENANDSKPPVWDF